MPSTGPREGGLHLGRLPHVDTDGRYLAVIEAAAGSRNKCKFEPTFGALVLHKVLPLGTSFPYAFGFIPSTLAEDGDALDVLVLMDEAVAPGTVVPVRLLGILQAQQTKGGSGAKPYRNDRVLAVADKTECYVGLRELDDVARNVLERIASFFAFYHAEDGDTFEALGWQPRAIAEAAVKSTHEAYLGD